MSKPSSPPLAVLDMRPPKKQKESSATAIAGVPGGASSAYNEEDNPTKAARKCRRPRLDDAREALRQLNLEVEVAKLEALGKAASLRLIKRKIQALLREVDK